MDDNIKIPPGFKILIIDDNIDFLNALTYTLTEKKIDVVNAKSGIDAIKILKKDYFNLILLDLKMPGMNGADTFKKIKEIQNKPYVVIISAYSEPEQMEMITKLKPRGFLQKPFYLQDLMPYIKTRIKEETDEN